MSNSCSPKGPSQVTQRCCSLSGVVFMQVVLYFQMYQNDRLRTKAIVSHYEQVLNTAPLSVVTARCLPFGISLSLLIAYPALTCYFQVVGHHPFGVSVHGQLGKPHRGLRRVFDVEQYPMVGPLGISRLSFMTDNVVVRLTGPSQYVSCPDSLLSWIHIVVLLNSSQ